jgi:ssRNA-specific RNase YbeY (16S rRNA maturation enzyme)
MGYDHITSEETDEMETFEKTLLSDLNIADPYRD